MPKTAYDHVTDEEMLERIQSGDQTALEALIERYRAFVRTKARPYFLIGADREDIIQEGMIGLYKAIRDYRGERLSSFRAFAEVCITRQMITAVKTATRQKHIPLNSYISLDKPLYEEESERTLLDILSDPTLIDPETAFIFREDFDAFEAKIELVLSDLERRVLRLYLDGRTYQEMAVDLKRQVKSIDNALQRVKRKLERLLESRELEALKS
ncbi:MAG: RNA polymerase sporulation sigma factor SigH [Candidatus Carbobacillus altaicus]|uniref:RNA polymerase sporulation specific sigma factor SigH n=1 Tax=Candidatus Carbonibacillus altaicus TaxID=2163959 RepID=A0A2R6Y2Z3_9BACL|nr:RNA polymerase sporulation sigma factor SigH [Candidatus Carbobacillus altaicus]PTQ57012.1 MAG: RNA polymerase sporulation specific sigma factor SigH [Candidatus Carbobacillus altaicus]